MARSARSILTSDPLVVKVLDVAQIRDNAKLVVVSFILNRVRYDDIFNVPLKLVKPLLTARRKEGVMATLIADTSDDLDNHPTVVAVDLPVK